ncbi:MAG: hypothetical protein KGL39_54550 [Patescibacteria group bacterium]|nr:hypothetical protein [Patescibacteria group bacterium]
MLKNLDVELNELHRTIVNSGVKMHQAQHQEEVDTGANPPKGKVVRSSGGSTVAPEQFATLKD